MIDESIMEKISLSRMKMRRWKRYRESLRVKAFL